MPKAPSVPDRLPLLEHNGTAIEAYQHHGFSVPDRGPHPVSRILYAARDQKNERHWRASLHEIEALIDRNFKAAASGTSWS